MVDFTFECTDEAEQTAFNNLASSTGDNDNLALPSNIKQ